MHTLIREKTCKEILFQRMLMAVISSIALQFILISFIALILNIMSIITSPLLSIESTWTIFMSTRVWCYLIVAAIIIALEGIICSKNYLNSPVMYADSRFIIFCKLFTPYNLMIGSIYILSGVMLQLVYLSLQNSKSHNNLLVKNCNNAHGICLIEEHLFLLMGGFWTGIYYYIKTNVFGLNGILQFPIIQQSKLPQIPKGINRILSSSMAGAVWPTVYYFILYYSFGAYLRMFIVSVIYSSKLEQEPLDTIWRLLNLSLMLNLWFYSSLFAITINSMHFLFQIHLTQWMQFQTGQNIYRNNNNNNNNHQTITLSDALSMNNVPIIQHLGYLDLVTLAQKENHRRSILFKLSQPGRHPYNWNCIIERCLLLINDFSDEIISPVMTPTRIGNEQNVQEITPLSSDMVSSSTERALFMSKMRNLTTNNSSSINPTVPQIIVTQHDQTSIGLQFLNEFIKSTKINAITYLLSKPLIFYLFGTPSDSKIQYLMINGQSVIWAADSISSLAVASIEEDLYGVVQKDLPSIIQALIHLKQSLDKFYKMNLLTKKPRHDDKQVRQMLTSLKVATKRSIYRIVTVFKNYIDDLILDRSLKDQLNNFFACKE